MNVKLIPASEVEVGMYIEDKVDGWLAVTSRTDPGFEQQLLITEHGKSTLVRATDWVMVGVSE